MQHIVVVFHECRRAPGAGKDVKFSARHCQRLLDERDPISPVMAQAEGFQLFVALIYVGVAGAREITTVNVCAGKLVANAFLVVEISGQNLALLLFRQHRKRFGRSVSQSSADAQESLKLRGRIDEHTDLGFFRLAHGFETHRASRRNSVISFGGCRIDHHLFSRSDKWFPRR